MLQICMNCTTGYVSAGAMVKMVIVGRGTAVDSFIRDGKGLQHI